MSFKNDDPIFLDRKFCSVEIFVPSQIQHSSETFELMASAWFGTIREDIQTADGLKSITIGLQSATLTIETCEQSRMRSDGRYRGGALTRAYEGSKDDLAEKARQLGGGGGFNWKLLSVLTLRSDAEASTSKSSSEAAKRNEDSKHDVFEIDTASPIDWSVVALNPARVLPHLNGAELRDVPLCTIDTPAGLASVKASLSLSARDLWLDVNSDQAAATLEDEANQRAVLSAIIGKAASDNRLGPQNDGSDETSVIVASSLLHRQQDREET